MGILETIFGRSEPKKEYRCCGKIFETGSGLGGHRASKNCRRGK